MTQAPVQSTELLLHELQAHDSALDLQNEQLRLKKFELQLQRDHYFDLYELAPVGYCTLNRKGKILDVNLITGQLLGVSRSAIKGKLINRFLFTEDLPIFHLHRHRCGLVALDGVAGVRETEATSI